jgi:N-acetylglucosaminyldiphosphoundecaprenol N-acetyl-beta-D-mannosaminyltransferase
MKNPKTSHRNLLGIELPTDSREDVLEKIVKYIRNPHGSFIILSLNPEIFVTMQKNPEFKKVAVEAQIKILDGVGVVLAARSRGISVGPRLTGVDMMDTLIQRASAESLSVMLIGGLGNVAEKVVDCYRAQYPALNIFGFQGIKNIQQPTEAELDKLFSIVADRKPHIIFFAFGSPMQELFVEKYKKHFTGIVCAGVGGAFDFLSGMKPRAPHLIRTIGLEWAYRLVSEPWRWRRQLRLISFIYYVIKDAVYDKRGYASR